MACLTPSPVVKFVHVELVLGAIYCMLTGWAVQENNVRQPDLYGWSGCGDSGCVVDCCPIGQERFVAWHLVRCLVGRDCLAIYAGYLATWFYLLSSACVVSPIASVEASGWLLCRNS